MCVLTVNNNENLNPLRTKSWNVILGNHEDRVWSKATALPPSSPATPFNSWFQWPLRSAALLVRVIAKTPFAKASFFPKRSPLFNLPQAIPRLSQMNIGFFSEHYMAFSAAYNTGMKRSIKFFFLLTWHLLLKINVSSQALSEIPMTLTAMFLTNHSLLASTLMTLFTFWRIPTSRNYSVTFSANVARWISWVLLGGFLVCTFCSSNLHP